MVPGAKPWGRGVDDELPNLAVDKARRHRTHPVLRTASGFSAGPVLDGGDETRRGTGDARPTRARRTTALLGNPDDGEGGGGHGQRGDHAEGHLESAAWPARVGTVVARPAGAKNGGGRGHLGEEAMGGTLLR